MTAELVREDFPVPTPAAVRLDAESRGRPVLDAGIYTVVAAQGERASWPVRLDVTGRGEAEIAQELDE